MEMNSGLVQMESSELKRGEKSGNVDGGPILVVKYTGFGDRYFRV